MAFIDNSKRKNQIFIFSQNRDWRLLLRDLVVNLEITHFAAELIPFLSKVSNENLKKKCFYPS